MIKTERVARPVEYVETEVVVCDCCAKSQPIPEHAYSVGKDWGTFYDGHGRSGKFHFCPDCTPSIVKLLEDARL